MTLEEQIQDILLSEFGPHYGQANALCRILALVEAAKLTPAPKPVSKAKEVSRGPF